MSSSVKIALVDDHVLLRNALVGVINILGYEVVSESSNGSQFIATINPQNLPDVVLMDINMPDMNGYEATCWLKENYPDIKVLGLSMSNDENAIIKLIKNGARGYLLKEATKQELEYAIESVIRKGYHYSDAITEKIVKNIREEDKFLHQFQELNAKEIEFLKLASSELTYKEIALQMKVSPRTIDGYRDALFEKLHIKSRVGQVMYAIKHGIVQCV